MPDQPLDPPPVAAAGAPAADLVRVRVDLAYDGTDFAGWARQPGLRTVQGVVEDGLALVLRSAHRGDAPPRVTVAGRTDAGVHARGQVLHVDVPAGAWAAVPGRSDRGPEESLLTRLAGVLPADVVATRVRVAPEGFDARFSAVARRYVYRVCDETALRDPLRRHHVLWSRRPLDVAAMHEAAQRVLGRHDFAAYCKPRPGATTIRTLDELTWERPADGPDAGLVVATVRADAFCHSMVRALVGASLAVGEGRRGVDWPAELLVGGRRDPGSAVVAAHGLTLEEVVYPPDAELAARQVRTRAPRSADDVDPHPLRAP
ncbi:tRNA pseudouridine synthase A [Cellulomonas hominis]|uniref:tRNA pseudouridine synthase A n=1 Tax=Cellulomonas hominis TaxID=156981 RepID=A0A511FGK3_9CELL|nr:tRNA pseudouridine(38-40) synthase TruA [Cellulomonas hominis]MBB5473748.1 tRNA pseudouridine38-40 synthase [Cellulomonas hominis]GEL47457.1 tRNA pseudouridine synthase A [Cellulomonas hominis]